jgi:hypothetical protein
VSFTFTAQSGADVLAVEFMDDVAAIQNARRAPDVLAGGESWLVARVTVPETALGDVVLDLTVSYEPLDAAGRAGARQTQSVQVSVPGGTRAVKSRGANAECLGERVKELTAARVQREATAKARAGDWAGVNHLVQGLRNLAGDNAYVGSIAANLAQTATACDANLFSKQAVYGAHTMSTRSALVNEDVTSLNDALGLRKGDQGRATTGA